ncbi:hypothetical protein HID58_059139 [Brassica napus]|uniref:Glycolipid transfer protein domain-containing protein n=1 Tax=Brassica napus TaxID=3708 RepID=A0ABQ7ZSP8_BRANA|nr:hypothetical protein HID58_059139 [Brassica napus]
MVRVLFQQIIASQQVASRGDNSLKDPASKSYAQVFAPQSSPWMGYTESCCFRDVRSSTRTHMLNEDEAEAKIQVESYVNASAPSWPALKPELDDIETLRSSFSFFSLCFISRSLNTHADSLAKESRSRDLNFVDIEVLQQLSLAASNNSLKDPSSKSYAQVFAPHHGWAIRKAVALGMYALPTRTHLLKMLNEEEAEAKIQMESYVNASAPVITYLDNLFLSKQLGIDW